MENLTIYNAVRSVPDSAKRQIGAGRLKGKTDINPMWRLKTLTEQFGPCGIGWKYVITDKRLEQGANGEVAAFLDIDLFVKVDGAWSEAIPGTGGSAFVAKEKNGPYTSDECFKMALTDAISVACKALGFGADVYWDADRSKYDKPAPATYPKGTVICEGCGMPIKSVTCQGVKYSPDDISNRALDRYGKRLCWGCMKAANAAEKKHE
nr:MAG TPA: DNA REPAIR PROTEIN RAD52 HOMOLOG-BINDING PROTEIN, DNA REPAIR, DNA.7A [Caudoviricetes sp.]